MPQDSDIKGLAAPAITFGVAAQESPTDATPPDGLSLGETEAVGHTLPGGSAAERSSSRAPLPGTSLVAHLSLLPSSVRLAFACRDTADIFSREVLEAEVSSIQPALASLVAFYNFLEESLEVANAVSPPAPPPGSLSCSVRLAGGAKDGSKPEVVFKSVLHPSHSFLPSLAVDMTFPRTYVGDAEEKHSIQLRKQAEWYEEALVAQEKKFEARVEEAVVDAVQRVEERLLHKIDELREMTDRLDAQLGGGMLKYDCVSHKVLDVTGTSFSNRFADRHGHLGFHLKTEKDLERLRICKSLTALDLKDSSVSSVSFLSGLSELKELDLDNNPKLTDLSPLSTLQKLEKLNLSKCTGLRDISVVEKIPSLTHLDIRSSGVLNVNSLAAREGLTVLK